VAVAGSQTRTSPSWPAEGGQPGPVRGDRQRLRPAGVASEDMTGSTVNRIPDPHRSILTGVGQPGPIPCDPQRADPVGVASEDMTGGAGDRIGSVIVSPVDHP
jgi:hypothetical protein